MKIAVHQTHDSSTLLAFPDYWPGGYHFSGSSSGLGAELSGPVVSVFDGDTIEVLRNQHGERIRLNGLDCQEKNQAYRKRAKQAAADLAVGK